MDFRDTLKDGSARLMDYRVNGAVYGYIHGWILGTRSRIESARLMDYPVNGEVTVGIYIRCTGK